MQTQTPTVTRQNSASPIEHKMDLQGGALTSQELLGQASFRAGIRTNSTEKTETAEDAPRSSLDATPANSRSAIPLWMKVSGAAAVFGTTLNTLTAQIPRMSFPVGQGPVMSTQAAVIALGCGVYGGFLMSVMAKSVEKKVAPVLYTAGVAMGVLSPFVVGFGEMGLRTSLMGIGLIIGTKITALYFKNEIAQDDAAAKDSIKSDKPSN